MTLFWILLMPLAGSLLALAGQQWSRSYQALVVALFPAAALALLFSLIPDVLAGEVIRYGFAWLPLTSIWDDLTLGRLKRLPLCSGASRKVNLYLLFSDADKLGPAARTFLGELRHQSIDLPTSDDV